MSEIAEKSADQAALVDPLVLIEVPVLRRNKRSLDMNRDISESNPSPTFVFFPEPGRVGRLLAQLGITCQKPLERALERDESLVQQWLRREYPRIRALARREEAEIYFGDAAHMRSDHHCGGTWGKKGETPVVSSTGARFRMSLISAVTARGHMRFMIKEKGGVNADVFIEFLKRLMLGSRSKIFLIVDRGPACREADQGVRCRPWRSAAAFLSAAVFPG